MKQANEDLQCLAVYDWDGGHRLQDWTNLIAGLLEELGFSGRANWSETETRNGRRKTTRGTPNVIALREVADAYNFEVVVGRPIPTRHEADSSFYASVAFELHGSRSAVICFPGAPDQGSRADHAGRLLKRVASYGLGRYGFARQSAAEPSPALHALGIAHGEPSKFADDDYAEECGRWMAERTPPRGTLVSCNRHLRHHVRDVFRHNLVGSLHLDHVSEGMKLRDEIARMCIGDLETADNGTSVWSVPQDSIPQARNLMRSRGQLLTDYCDLWKPKKSGAPTKK